jgi:hypothetical protein
VEETEDTDGGGGAGGIEGVMCFFVVLGGSGCESKSGYKEPL